MIEIRRDWKRQEVEIGAGIIWSTAIPSKSKSADMGKHSPRSKMSRIRSESLRLIRSDRLKSVKLALKLNANIGCIVSLSANKSKCYIAVFFAKNIFLSRENGRERIVNELTMNFNVTIGEIYQLLICKCCDYQRIKNALINEKII